MSAPLLEVRDLRVHFPVRGGWLGRGAATVRAVDGVGFSLQAGATLGVVGESGCGKSTLARALLRLVPATGGQVLWNGHDVLAMREDELRSLRRELRMVFQDPLASLNPRMTVGQLVGEPLELFCPEMGGAQRTAAVRAMLAKVGLPPEALNRYPHEFSGGQCQRISIARALVGSPRMLICDESVSALDVSIRAQILNLLADLQAETGIALLFVSHDLSVVKHVSTDVLVMYLGRVMELGPAERVLAAPAHPYTRALLDAVPIPDPELARDRRRVVLHGDLPSPLAPPSGCVFRTRCRLANPKCGIDTPALAPAASGTLAACHYPGAAAA